MPLPADLERQIQALSQTLAPKQRKELQENLSNRYRTQPQKALRSKEEAILYLTTRLPATFGVGERVLSIVKETYPAHASITSILDVGAGPGASRWLFEDLFPALKTCTLVEQNSHMLAVGHALIHSLGTFQAQDYRVGELSPHDLVYASYTLSELKPHQQSTAVDILWTAAETLMVLIEPGTPQGFDTIRRARKTLIEKGAFILAPCGHESPCPMQDKDWCHFSVRIPRSKAHQQAKQGTLSFEDEKFSYLIVSKTPATQELPPRLMRKPIKGKGHMILDTCTKEGLKRQTVSKSKDKNYKHYAKLEWGDGV